ncbi:MAG: hypothetical protein WCK31_00485, partial [bacterium]
LPTITRSIEVQSMNKFNVSSVASDDHYLKTHAYYIAPAKFSLDPSTSCQCSPVVWPFISQYRANSDGTYTYLGKDQFASVKAVTPVNDFTPITYTGSTNESRFNDNGAYDANGNKVLFKRSLTNVTSDTRTAQYELDLTTLANQTVPYEIKFGNGNNGTNNGAGRWYAEDLFCNYSNPVNQNLSVGSPWLQSKTGSTFIKGPADTSLYAANESIHQISSATCAPLSSTLSQQNTPSFCIEANDTYLSSYLYQSSASSGQAGPLSEANISSSDRKSKYGISSSSYLHGMTKVSSYFKGATGAYEYVKNVVQKAIDDADESNPINSPCSSINIGSHKRVLDVTNSTYTIATPGGSSGGYDLLNYIDGDNNEKPCFGNGALESGVNVVRFSNDLVINKPPDPVIPVVGGVPNFTNLPSTICTDKIALMRLQQKNPVGNLETTLNINYGTTFKAVVAKTLNGAVTTATNAVIHMQAPNGEPAITIVGSNGEYDNVSFPASSQGQTYVFVATVDKTCRSNYAYLHVNGTLQSPLSPATYSPAPGSGVPAGTNIQAGDNQLWPHWYLSNDTIMLVKGNVTINPDIRKDLEANGKSLIIIAGGNIDILQGTYKSYQKTSKTEYPFYDDIDAFLIADGQIRTEADNPAGAIVLDGLRINGGLVQLGINTSTFTHCTTPFNGSIPRPDETNSSLNPCFNRDLVLMHNLIAPAEKISYDPQVEEVFSLAIGELNTVYSIRETKTKTTGALE